MGEWSRASYKVILPNNSSSPPTSQSPLAMTCLKQGWLRSVVPNCLAHQLHIPEHSLSNPSVPEYQVCVALHPLLVHSCDGQHDGDRLAGHRTVQEARPSLKTLTHIPGHEQLAYPLLLPPGQDLLWLHHRHDLLHTLAHVSSLSSPQHQTCEELHYAGLFM